MLVLSRKRGERICIGGRLVTLEVVDIRGDKVRIGLTAPEDVSIHREEILDAIERKAAEEEKEAPVDGSKL